MEMRNCVIFNGYDLRDYGMYVSGDKTFNSPSKAYRRVSVPGRSGDLLTFTGKYENVDVTYDAILIEDYERNAAAIRSILMSAHDYCRLEDSYHKDEYRMGIFQGPVDFDSVYLQAGHTQLTFNCKPERWLKSGEESVCLADNTTPSQTIILNFPDESVETTYYVNENDVHNYTMFASKPLFTIEGYGKIMIAFIHESESDVRFSIYADLPQPTTNPRSYEYYIDCDRMAAYRIDHFDYGDSYIRMNDKVRTYDEQSPSYDQIADTFPTIRPGQTEIDVRRVTPTTSKVYVTPRWYIL